MPQSIILKRSALQGKVPTTSSLNLGEIAINTYDGKLYLNRSGSVQSIQEIITTNVVNTGSITLTQTGSFGELVVSKDGNFQRDIYVTQDIIGNGSIDILYDVTASAFLGAIRATNGVISSSAQLTSLNSFTASAGIRLTNLETTSASLLIETQNLELFSASALNRLSNLEIKTGSYATTGSNTFRGNQIVSGSITTSGSVSIVASGSNVFTVDGTSGRLFSIDDSLSGSLFSVNTAAGLPVIEAFSDNTIRIGQFGQRALFVSQSRVGIGKESGLNATLDVSGSAIFSGSLSVFGQFTASLQSGFALVGGPNNTSVAVATSSFAAGGTSGTASWANNAISSSYPFRVTGSGSVSIYSANAGEGTNNDFSYFIGYKAGLSASNSTYATYIGDFAGAIDNGSPTYAHAGVMVGSDAGYNANNSFLGVYIGNRAGMNATNASQSVFIGTQAGESGSQAANSVMIGGAAGLFASQSMGAIFIGASAGARAAGAYEMVAMGYTAGGGVSTTYASNAFRSVFIGSGAGGGATNASNTIALGYGSGQLATNASSSVFIGNQAGVSNSNASFSNFIGYRAGFNGGSLLGQNNTIIGTNITLPAGYSNYANIGAVLFISGTYSTTTGNPTQNISNGRVGINVINPEFNFDVSGSGRYTNGLTITGSLTNGQNVTASGIFSHAEGYGTLASGSYSHAEGYGTIASGSYSHAEGIYTIAWEDYSHAEGYGTIASGSYSHAEGEFTEAIGLYSHAEGTYAEAWGDYAHSEGDSAKALGDSSHAEGYSTIARGNASHAEGWYTVTSGSYSHAEGRETTTIGGYSHAEGWSTIASGSYSHAEGRNTMASGNYSHAEGFGAVSVGQYSHAEGVSTEARADYSHAEGFSTIASGEYQHVQGQYNISSSAPAAFIIGNGTSNTARRNLVFASGSVFEITGSLNVSGSITGSLFGTASWANNVVSASFASTSSVALRGLITASVAGATITFTKGDSTTFDLTIAQSGTVATASYVTSSGVFGPFGSNSILSASFALTASFAPNYVLNSTTASFATTGSNSFVGNQIITGSLILSGSSSTSLLSTNADTILITGSAIITGSVVVTGSFQLSGSARITNGLVVTGSTSIVGDVSTGNTITVGGATNTAGVLNFFNGNVGISRSGASGLLFRVGTNNTAATITQERLVGIGTESPTALLHVSGTIGGLFEIDSVTVPNILYVSSSGNIGVGTITPSASLHVLGTNSAATYSLWVQNSLGETLISAQNDRTININATNATNGNTNIGTTNGTITFVRGYNNTFIGNALTFYIGGPASTIQGFNVNPGIAIGYAGTTVNPNPGTGLSIRGTTTTSGSGVLFVTGSSSTRLLALASETNPNAFVVSGSGRVGINQPNPEFNFDVSGSSRFAGNMVITGSLSLSGSSPLIQLGSTAFVGDVTNPTITIGSTSNGIFLDTNRVFFKAGGSFAGGFSSDGIIANQILIRNGAPNDLTTAMYIPYRLSTIGLLGGLGGNSAGDITLITSGSSRLFVSSSGNIGIGTNTPSTLLHISGSTGGFRINNSEFHNTSSLTTSGTTTISQLATGSYISAFYNYSIISASNARAGQIMSIWSGSTATYTEVTTTDIGNTSPASFAVNVVGSNVQLNFTAPGTWTVRTIANLL
jgi:hypothetical protein